MIKIGLDVGSTTLKCVVIGENGEILFKSYNRHFSQITQKTTELLESIKSEFPKEKNVLISISGSAGMGMAQALNIPFVQEVYATRAAVSSLMPDSDTVIELGGEDAKILFLTDGLEVRMNGSCAGGTGAFIDQMSTLLKLTPSEMNELSKSREKIYTIASRCGVFAKSDIQPLINQGAKPSDISASIFYAVVNQTIAGLAQGREIKGNVLYLGGPLTFMSELRASFDDVLNLTGVCPENSLYFVALGAVFAADLKEVNINKLIDDVSSYQSEDGYKSCPPLFNDEEEYQDFLARHSKSDIKTDCEYSPGDEVFIGIDAGSTTVKAVAVNFEGDIIYSEYMQNSGNPVPIVKGFLTKFYEDFPKARIRACASTGYGEEIIKNAFLLDFGIVETIAHFTAAKKFLPEVDFIIDIGGQDIKCFKIRNGAIDNIFLNEACSSGCGSFLQTFAGALEMPIDKFATLGLFADKPVDLGSRCTVFMNSSVKQAQKDGAAIENISAGLSISVVKNALYKVIRTANSELLGENIVVQGGTFLNDAVLRAFEQEIGENVIRPNVAGLMGAYGAALYAQKACKSRKSTVLSYDQLKSFTHKVNAVTCSGCSNNCKLTVNTFEEGRKFIGGNRCEKPLKVKSDSVQYNLFEEKQKLLASYRPIKGKRGKIGIPMALAFYETLPFWHTFFTKLDFEVIVSPSSNRKLYLDGQHTIPSDTVCFPAKLVHGHIEALLREKPDAIFYPCMTYNFDEGKGDNHYNCPVVAYYPEVLSANITSLNETKFIYDYISFENKNLFIKKIRNIMKKYFIGISASEIKLAAETAYREYFAHMDVIREMGEAFISAGRKLKKPIIIVAGRPYHLDPEVNHGIDQLICDLGAVIVTDEAVSPLVDKIETNVLNQWTYHSRMYSAAEYVTQNPDINLVQLVSFGCGVDAVTTDEVREILEDKGKIYTQVKIDEITNLGAVKIRLRSLFAALEQEKEALIHA